MTSQSGFVSVVRSRGAGVVLLILGVLAANQTSIGQRPIGDSAPPKQKPAPV